MIFSRKIPSILSVSIAWINAIQGWQPAAAAPDPQVKPTTNIVFILADDLGWKCTTCFETTQRYRTLNMQRRAKGGMLFTLASPASPLCSPTRASILKEKSPASVGITARLDTKYFTLAEALKQAGNTTAHFEKLHLGPEPYLSAPVELHWADLNPAKGESHRWDF